LYLLIQHLFLTIRLPLSRKIRTIHRNIRKTKSFPHG